MQNMQIKWRDILFGFYCLGCVALVFLALMGYKGFVLALIYAGFTLLFFLVLAIVSLLKKRLGVKKWAKKF